MSIHSILTAVKNINGNKDAFLSNFIIVDSQREYLTRYGFDYTESRKAANEFFRRKFGLDFSRSIECHDHEKIDSAILVPYFVPKCLEMEVSYCKEFPNRRFKVAEGGFIAKITEPGFIVSGRYEKVYLPPDTLIFWGYYVILENDKIFDRFKFYSEHPTRVDKTLGLLFRHQVEFDSNQKGRAQGFFILNQEHEDHWDATINSVLTC